jgi:hypothetical protein
MYNIGERFWKNCIYLAWEGLEFGYLGKRDILVVK